MQKDTFCSRLPFLENLLEDVLQQNEGIKRGRGIVGSEGQKVGQEGPRGRGGGRCRPAGPSRQSGVQNHVHSSSGYFCDMTGLLDVQGKLNNRHRKPRERTLGRRGRHGWEGVRERVWAEQTGPEVIPYRVKAMQITNVYLTKLWGADEL